MPTARGPLDVNMEAEPPFLEQDGLKLNRNVVRKEFSGDMVGTSEAQMIAAFTGTPGSAGYVAIEHFTGSVGGKSGSFVLQHNGVMNRGDAQLDDHDCAGLGLRRAGWHIGDAGDRQRRGPALLRPRLRACLSAR